VRKTIWTLDVESWQLSSQPLCGRSPAPNETRYRAQRASVGRFQVLLRFAGGRPFCRGSRLGPVKAGAGSRIGRGRRGKRGGGERLARGGTGRGPHNYSMEPTWPAHE
jgi:hypothetical protein